MRWKRHLPAAFVPPLCSRRASKITKPMQGHFAKGSAPAVKIVREVGVEAASATKTANAEGEAAETNGVMKAGDKVLVDIFSDEKFVDVVGTSKGRGFAGVVRRHGFGGGPKSHGHMFQVQGSIGASSFPSRPPGARASASRFSASSARPAESDRRPRR